MGHSLGQWATPIFKFNDWAGLGQIIWPRPKVGQPQKCLYQVTRLGQAAARTHPMKKPMSWSNKVQK